MRYAKTNNTTRRMRSYITYIDPQTNEKPHNLAIPLPERWRLFTPVRCILGQNIQKIQVLPSHNNVLLLLSVYPIYLSGKIQEIVLRMRSEDIWSIDTTGHEGSADEEVLRRMLWPASDPQQSKKVVMVHQFENQDIVTNSMICNDRYIQKTEITHFPVNFIAGKTCD